MRLPILAILLLAARLGAQTPAVETLPIENLRERLESLDPSDPMAYFELGEEVAQEFQTPEELALARELYAIAFDLDREAGGRHGASIALALADLVGIGGERDWLLSLAHTLDRRLARPDWHRAATGEASLQSTYLAALAVGRVRAGQGREARELLSLPEVRAIIRRYGALLSPIAQPADAWLDREARRWPCPECHQQRVSKAVDAARGAFVACRVCGGNPGPELSTEEFIATLRFEARMLRGVQRSWSAQVIADGGAPVRDPDPAELSSILGIDTRRTLWRNGRWIAPEGSEAPADPVEERPKEDTPELDEGDTVGRANRS